MLCDIGVTKTLWGYVNKESPIIEALRVEKLI